MDTSFEIPLAGGESAYFSHPETRDPISPVRAARDTDRDIVHEPSLTPPNEAYETNVVDRTDHQASGLTSVGLYQLRFPSYRYVPAPFPPNGSPPTFQPP